jgi:hypothetical protein
MKFVSLKQFKALSRTRQGIGTDALSPAPTPANVVCFGQGQTTKTPSIDVFFLSGCVAG